MTKNCNPLRSLTGFRAGALMSVLVAATGCSTSVDSPRGGGSQRPPGEEASGSGGANANGSGGAPGAQGTGATPAMGGGVNPPGTGGTAPVIPVTPTEGPARGVLRLLTNEEYRNTIRSLLNFPAVPSDDLQPETVSQSYRNFSDVLIVTGTLGGQYASLAARVAREVTDFQTLAPCAEGAAPRECAGAFVRNFGKLAYRRPVTDAEVEIHLGLFDGELARSSYQEGIRLVLEAMLQAPNLLYRFELGTPSGNTRTLNSYESASLLSYMLTSNPPDPELMAGADADALATPSGRETHARRLLATDLAKGSIRSFMRQWSQIDILGPLQKNETVYPTYSAELWASMLAETNQFFDSVMWQGDGTFKTLMTSGNSFADGPLSTLYGSDNQSAPGTLMPIALNPAQRSGLLTQASVLASHSKLDESFPIARGKLVRTRFLCQDLPPPPPAIANEVVPIPVDPTRTGRETFEAHSMNPACAGCHALIDPVGFGLENYDGIGQWRTLDNNKPINPAGNMTATRDIDGPFTGVELAQKLSTSSEAQDCFSLQAMRWAFGRETFKSTTDRQTATAITTQVGAGLNMQEALVALIKSDSFVVRSAQ
ncbi:MAG: DUF1592 domain-containing protein [Polyangiaceae bacterium]|nr:DUF1592 domain-containing protein [Polyangiaceae bacterium]